MDDDHEPSPLHALAFALIIDGAGHVLLVRHNYEGHFHNHHSRP